MTDSIFFQNNGYLIFDTHINHELLDSVVNSLVFDRYQTRIQDAWQFNSFVKEISIHPNILSKIKEVYNKNPLPFQTLNFNYGTSQPAHSDTIHFNTNPKGNMCGVWVALENIHENNGPLFYYPKSHLLPEITYQDIGISDLGHQNYHLYETFIENMLDKNEKFQKHLGLLQKGQAIIWASNLLHGGSIVKDIKSTRHSQVTHYFFESTYYYTPMMSDSRHICFRQPSWIK